MSLLAWLALPLVAALVYAALEDLRQRRIPNGAVLVAALAGLAWRLAGGAAFGELVGTLVAALGVFLVGFLLWRGGFLGGGDVKLLAAAALALPPRGMVDFLLLTALAGGLLALGQMMWARLGAALLGALLAHGRGSGRLGPATLTGCSGTGASVPYGVAITLGALGALLGGWPGG